MAVKAYTTPTCPFCRMARDFLKGRGVEFEEINVVEDKAGAKEMIEKSGQLGVPVIDIDGTIVVGFDRARIEAALDSR